MHQGNKMEIFGRYVKSYNQISSYSIAVQMFVRKLFNLLSTNIFALAHEILRKRNILLNHYAPLE